MTITEATAVNVVLDDLIARHRAEEESGQDLHPEPEPLVDAAATLAAKARQALNAGLSSDDVRAALS